MKSLGVAVVLAQSGFYVPATSMRFSLCDELFTRIVARDNLEKGLSSFAVEMIELKNIFNRCSPKSLILGDEISHGTETLSAIAIVAATIKKLVDEQALFLFTTHLHQIHELDVMKKVEHVASVHMEVHYDEENDKLIFDRTLSAGCGDSIYGLEFAQSLHIDADFLKHAMEIRKKLTDDYTDIEKLTQQKKSTYTKDVFLTSCAICEGSVEDVHHIKHQKDADEHGRVDHFHKDHKYNLLPICKNCHHKIHDGEVLVKGFNMTSTGLELDYEQKK
jgi:DNA mismatch repair protein MutS